MRRVLRRLLIALVLAGGTGWQPTLLRAAPKLRVDFVAVGQGDAALITSPVGKTVLIDGGPHEAGDALASFVRTRTPAKLDLVVLSHRHADHLGGLAQVLRSQGAELFMDAVFPHRSPAYDALVQTVTTAHIPLREATRGRIVDLGGGARLTLLGPPEPVITGTRSDVNTNSVVIRLDFGTVGVLFAGDAEAPTESWLLGSGVKLAAQVLKVAHHGGRYSSGARFLAAVAPSVAVISVGAGNRYGHPSPETIERLEKRGTHVFRTDTDGTITIETDGTRLWTKIGKDKAEEIVRR